MAITTAFPTSAKAEFLAGTHTSSDTYKLVLLKASVSGTYGAATTNYSQVTGNSDEASGTGYTAGGITLSGFNVTTSGTSALLDFSDPTPLSSATISADGCVIINTSKSNKVIYVGSFGGTITSTAGTFTIDLPSAGAGTSLLRIA